MKSQDIGLLLKLVSMRKKDHGNPSSMWPGRWKDRVAERGADDAFDSVSEAGLPELQAISIRYSARALEQGTGISKSQVNLALKRCIDVGLARMDRKNGVPRANSKALYEFIVYGLKYVFPARPGELTRGMTTSIYAPVLEKRLLSAGEIPLVWPDSEGTTQGQRVEPLFKSAVHAAKRDQDMYAMLALVDAIRLGNAREAEFAADILKQELLP